MHGLDRFVHDSTDEVYGPLRTGAAHEDDPLRPTVPYAASKAAAEHIALSYFHTYGLPVCVTRSSNNYGPGQHHEKLVPHFITQLLAGRNVPVHGRGQHVRNWLHVEDNCQGIDLTTKQMTALLLTAVGATWDRVEYVADRPANDIRYSMDCGKARADLGYQPRWDLHAGLAQTVQWYRNNQARWDNRGNHCRSPIAATILASRGRATVEVRSAGLHPSRHADRPAHPLMIAAAQHLDYDITGRLGVETTPHLLAWADLVLAMDRAVLDEVLQRQTGRSALYPPLDLTPARQGGQVPKRIPRDAGAGTADPFAEAAPRHRVHVQRHDRAWHSERQHPAQGGHQR